jgi:hypothetical protein
VTFSSLNPSLQHFSPQNLDEFLKQYPKIKKALGEEKKGIPFSMILTPWSDVLLWNDWVKEKDLDFFNRSSSYLRKNGMSWHLYCEVEVFLGGDFQVLWEIFDK